MTNVKIKERLRCSGFKKRKEAELSAKTYEMSSKKASGGVLKETNTPGMELKIKKPLFSLFRTN